MAFDQVKAEKARLLDENKDIVLATSLNTRVTARAVKYASEGLTIISFTLTNLKKVAQIRANPKVALCLNNASIEGKAEIVSQQEEEGKGLQKSSRKSSQGILNGGVTTVQR